jgi:hypothetical protein
VDKLQEQAARAAHQLDAHLKAERRLQSLRPNQPIMDARLLKLLSAPNRTRAGALLKLLQPKLEAARKQAYSLGAQAFFEAFQCKFVPGMSVEVRTYLGPGCRDQVKACVLLDIVVERPRNPAYGAPLFRSNAMALVSEGRDRAYNEFISGDDTVVDLTP